MLTYSKLLLQQYTLFLIASFLCFDTFSQEFPWISYPSASVNDYGVFHFRKSFQLDQLPEQLIVQISADNRYQFFVNGQRVCYGPAKGDLTTYKYDRIDLAPWLKTGKNQLAALVYNAGKDKPMSLLSVQTAFMFKTEESKFSKLNSGPAWKVYKNPAYTPVSYQEMLFDERWFYGFYACGPGDEVDAKKYPWGWEEENFDDATWPFAELLSFDGPAPWKLIPRNIPFMDAYREKPARIRLVEEVKNTEGFIQKKSPMRIPANTQARILFDYEIFTMGYPELRLRYGKGSSAKLKYAEALYEKVNLKAHRDSVNGKIMYGVWDLFHTDGEIRTFRPLWKRAFRYMMLEIETEEEALEILSLESEYSGYPYPDMATFESNNDRLNEVFEMGLRSLRMCSGETYYDTPFYEQLSYGGDNRPIAAISTYNSTDDRLLREVFRLYPQSVNRETGLFHSAYPSRFGFDHGTWSLAWIQSLYDYYLVRGDAAFVKQFKEDIAGVLAFFRRHMDEEKGILGELKCRNFLDWSITKGSIPRRDDAGLTPSSTMLTLYYVHTLDCAARLFRYLGEEEGAENWEKEAEEIKKAIQSISYNEDKKLYTDYPGQEVYSQHSNILAILCDMGTAEEQKELLNRILTYDEFDEYASTYFSFHLFKAMRKTKSEDLFLQSLDLWYDFIDMGHTTCGETGFASHDRSDCHAWSAHPSYFLLSMVCGIKAADIGFNKVEISPQLGDLNEIKASMPHTKGKINVSYSKKDKDLHARIELPPGLEGSFEYNGVKRSLSPGKNEINISGQ